MRLIPKNTVQALIEVFTEYGIPLNAKKNDVLLSVPLVKDIAALWRMAYYDDEWESAFVSIVTSKYLLPWNVLLPMRTTEITGCLRQP